jgi:serine/threonine-protein kinase
MSGALDLPDRLGRYVVARAIGEGAMGRVLLAHDPVLDRDVAIKLLRGDLGLAAEEREALLARMRNEARAAARVAHPNIVTLHDMIESEAWGICLVFELVEGQTLKQRIARGPLPGPQVARIAREIGGALAVAHVAGVLHRDVKPENVMLAEHGAKIADFGIARVPDSTLTRAGGLLGTPAYSAPECIRGGSFSPASDQFSLAASLYEALSAERAFPGDDAVTVAACVGTREPPPIAASLGLSERVDRVLTRALSKDPSERYESCCAFGESLASALEADAARTLLAPPLSLSGPKARPLGFRQSVALGAVAAAAIVALGLLSALRTPSPSNLQLVEARGPASASARASASQARPAHAGQAHAPVRHAPRADQDSSTELSAEAGTAASDPDALPHALADAPASPAAEASDAPEAPSAGTDASLPAPPGSR